MARPTRLLLLGGTTEATGLARRLADRPDLVVVSSLAGRTVAPARPPGEWRIGGFGGVAGLVGYLSGGGVDVVVDATHPFAAVMRWHAAEACTALGLPRLRLERPPWGPVDCDRWLPAGDLAASAAVIAAGAWARVMLTTGRSDLDAFVPAADGRRAWLIRSIDPPDRVPLSPAEVVLDRGPFSLAGETQLMARHRVDLLVTKNSGGTASAPKLAAARARGIDVVMVGRPPSPAGPAAATVDEAVEWLAALGVLAPG